MPRFFRFPTSSQKRLIHYSKVQDLRLKLPKILAHDGKPIKKNVPLLKKPTVLTLNMTLMQLVGGATNFNRLVIEESNLKKISADKLMHYHIAKNPPEEMLCLHRDINVLSLKSFLEAIENSDLTVFNDMVEIPYYYFFRTNKKGLTLLEVACQQGNLQLVRLILDVCKHYPPIDGLDNVANIWVCAINSGKKEIVQELLDQSGHCISLMNVKPQFLKSIATVAKQEEIYDLFEKYFAAYGINTEHEVLMTSLSSYGT